MSTSDDFTDHGAKPATFSHTLKLFCGGTPENRQLPIGNKSVSALIAIKVRRDSHFLQPLFAPELALEKDKKTIHVVGSGSSLLSSIQPIEAKADVFDNFLCLRHIDDVKGIFVYGTVIDDLPLLEDTEFDDKGEEDFVLASIPKSIICPFETPLTSLKLDDAETAQVCSAGDDIIGNWHKCIQLTNKYAAKIDEISRVDDGKFLPAGAVAGATSFVTTIDNMSDVEDSKAIKALKARLHANAAPPPAPAPVVAAAPVAIAAAAPTVAAAAAVTLIAASADTISPEEKIQGIANHEAIWICGHIDKNGSLNDAGDLSVFKPTTMGRNLMEITKKSARSDYTKRAILTKFRENCKNPKRDALYNKATSPSSDNMMNSYIANAEWHGDPERELSKMPARGLVLRHFGMNDRSTVEGARSNQENEAKRKNEADLGIEEGDRTRASTSVSTGQRIDSLHAIQVMIANWHMHFMAIADEEIGMAGQRQPQCILLYIMVQAFDLIEKHTFIEWTKNHHMPHLPYAFYGVLTSCVRLLVQFQQDLTTIEQLVDKDYAAIDKSDIGSCLDNWRAFAKNLAHCANMDCSYNQFPSFTPQSKLPTIQINIQSIGGGGGGGDGGGRGGGGGGKGGGGKRKDIIPAGTLSAAELIKDGKVTKSKLRSTCFPFSHSPETISHPSLTTRLTLLCPPSPHRNKNTRNR